MHSWSWPVLLALSSIAVLYLWGWRTVQASFPCALRTWRAAAFAAGIATLAAALGSPLAMLDHHYLTAHMAGHLLIMTVAVPLILLGAPFVVLVHALPPAMFASFPRRLALVHPVLCWLAGIAVVIVWHVPVIFALGMKSGAWHWLEQATFVIAGILFWWPVVRPWPAVAKWPLWSIPVYLFLAALPCDALSAFLCFCNRVVYAQYAPANHGSEVMALRDQCCAGALMWVWVTFAYLIPAAVLTFHLLSPEKRFIEERVL